MTMWKVVPLSKGQLLDVHLEDVLDDGLYRRCDSYRGGGGYDRFPYFAADRFGGDPDEYRGQFVVQLQGCNLDCPYCYVTRAGVWGEPLPVETRDLVRAFVRSGERVFHLMGGAPALYLKYWPELIEELRQRAPGTVFHSDFTLTERLYDRDALRAVVRRGCLYAVSVKGLTPDEWQRNTRKPFNEGLFWANWRLLYEVGVPVYVTFTGCRREGLRDFWKRAACLGIDPFLWQPNSYVIKLIDYAATAHVDDVPWGAQRR